MKRQALLISTLLCLASIPPAGLAQQARPGAGPGPAAGPGPGGTGLPVAESPLFAGSGVCARCHDGLLEDGVDVSPVNLWQASMMANSAKDPLWRAKVSAEAAEFPAYAGAIEQKCMKCHAPAVYVERYPDYGIADLEDQTDPLLPLWRDGDTCTVCHQIQPEGNADPALWWGESESFGGGFTILDGRRIFGPYDNLFANPMVKNAAFTPLLAYPTDADPTGAWTIGDPEHCATCHNLYTSPLSDPAAVFPEQMAYYEWLTSVYADPAGGQFQTCQDCHMPTAAIPMKISTAARNRIAEREPFWYHDFVGGNEFMLGLLQANAVDLGVTATAAHFDEKRARTADMLAAGMTLGVAAARNGPSLTVDVTLTNGAGHKQPTGIPLRRMWIHLKVSDQRGRVVFESGAWDAAGEILGLDPWPAYQNHHRDPITAPEQVQIYETVLADIGGGPTRALMHAASYLKDNRLPARGFVPGADPILLDIAVIGLAADDPDFNAQGSGADTVTYAIDLSGTPGQVTVEVEVCYQAVTPTEATYLGGVGTAAADRFVALYAGRDNRPLVSASQALTVR